MITPFWYDLPADRIAQRPVRPYHLAKLLVVDRGTGHLTNSSFLNLPEFFRAGDLIVFNNTKVIPARLFGELAGSGGAIEILLLEELSSKKWRVLGRPLRKFLPGKVIKFGENLSCQVISKSDTEAVVEFVSKANHNEVELRQQIHDHGIMPIPPYIRDGVSDDIDKLDYQTPFGEVEGSVAAPTASLHFTDEVMAQIKKLGIEVATLTLHLNTASFQPLVEKDSQLVKSPPAERISVPTGLREQILETKKRGGRVIGVGTSVVRSLESIFHDTISVDSTTELFIKPGHKFRAVDIVVTNFHQPGTSHLLLVEALMGRDLLAKSYQHALDNSYRFLSYGDGMVIF